MDVWTPFPHPFQLFLDLSATCKNGLHPLEGPIPLVSPGLVAAHWHLAKQQLKMSCGVGNLKEYRKRSIPWESTIIIHTFRSYWYCFSVYSDSSTENVALPMWGFQQTVGGAFEKGNEMGDGKVHPWHEGFHEGDDHCPKPSHGLKKERKRNNTPGNMETPCSCFLD